MSSHFSGPQSTTSTVPLSSPLPAAQVASSAAQYVERRLQCSPHADLRSVRVTERDGAIRLDGQVGSYYAKQLAQVVAREADENCRIDNALDVALS
jgi:hypothetical protein